MPSRDNGASRNRVSHLLAEKRRPPPIDLGPARSGRGFVLALIFVITTVALSLFVAFRQWKSQHLELADYGARRVAPVVVGWDEKVPAGFDAARWRQIVGQCQKLVVAWVGSGALELEDMRRLRTDIQLRVDRSDARNAASQLALFWGELEAQAGPRLTNAPRFELAAAIRFLTRAYPPGIDEETWSLALLETRAMLVALGHDPTLTRDKRIELRDVLNTRLQKSNAEKAASDLDAVWEMAEGAHALPAGYVRPKLK